MIVSFLSDYGLADEFAGLVKAVICHRAPGTEVVDVTHALNPFDVRRGAVLLRRAAPYLLPGVVLAVVDPGVAAGPPPVAVEVEGGHLVGPDNGLLPPAADQVGGVRRAVALTARGMRLPAAGPTFAGRDVMAPAVAHLSAGGPMEELGETVRAGDLVRVPLPGFRREADALVAEVAWVDRFGNVQLPLGADDLGSRSAWRVRAHRSGAEVVARRAPAFAEIGRESVGVVIDSYGCAALAVDRGNAGELLGLRDGDEVTLAPC